MWINEDEEAHIYFTLRVSFGTGTLIHKDLLKMFIGGHLSGTYMAMGIVAPYLHRQYSVPNNYGAKAHMVAAIHGLSSRHIPGSIY